jgi:hypothetical protein
MNYYFVDIKDHFIILYLDNMIVYSKAIGDHLGHLRHVFEKRKNFGIFHNPNKLFFGTK